MRKGKGQLTYKQINDAYMRLLRENKKLSRLWDSTTKRVDVVRCQECRHYEMGVCLKIYDDGAASRYAWQGRKPDDFCSYGKRKEGADNEP